MFTWPTFEIPVGTLVRVYYNKNAGPLPKDDGQGLQIKAGLNKWEEIVFVDMRRNEGALRNMGSGADWWEAKWDLPTDLFRVDFVIMDKRSGAVDNNGAKDFGLGLVGGPTEKELLEKRALEYEEAEKKRLKLLQDEEERIWGEVGKKAQEEGEEARLKFRWVEHGVLFGGIGVGLYGVGWRWGGVVWGGVGWRWRWGGVGLYGVGWRWGGVGLYGVEWGGVVWGGWGGGGVGWRWRWGGVGLYGVGWGGGGVGWGGVVWGGVEVGWGCMGWGGGGGGMGWGCMGWGGVEVGWGGVVWGGVGWGEDWDSWREMCMQWQRGTAECTCIGNRNEEACKGCEGGFLLLY